MASELSYSVRVRGYFSNGSFHFAAVLWKPHCSASEVKPAAATAAQLAGVSPCSEQFVCRDVPAVSVTEIQHAATPIEMQICTN